MEQFAKFLIKYAGESVNLLAILRTLVGAIPLDHQDRDKIVETITALENAAGNIAKAGGEIAKSPAKAVIKQSDIEKLLKPLVEAEVKRQLKNVSK